ncbi:hypothetical protein NDA01_29705 [Trichocoleus desertorum AS-A10]|uniref:hypothetical protein n=1 Tax=Trichocoleus desertorum TaxID=1481672 RepID=UPI00329A21DF
MHKFYFSGVASKDEQLMLEQAGITNILVDPIDLKHVLDWGGSLALDSGEYRRFRHQLAEVVDIEEYLFKIARSRSIDWMAAPDLFAEPLWTLARWNQIKHWDVPNLVPVWSWDAPLSILHQYLDEAPWVGIGGCVPWMHLQGKENLKAKRENLATLKSLCQQHPNRFHLFGLCWEEAIEVLTPYLHSADSSHWLCGARKGQVIFMNSRTGRLGKAPAKALPFAKDWSREQRCIENAKVLAQFTAE